ncbi:Protein CBR-SRV-22 [Caenorhabditis briggsae]|uniref:Protein CBR-SRV-22 n=1 Tax=Caenorhabditis briggsae TaxID=6238 RepID=A8XWJ9_CAEBR|nr:Protein CBR-SRV-22 [Caenorhabditis briggsae]CAP37018.2 Protein CBR-SRV-22 [Caenorhabditis briggsae]
MNPDTSDFDKAVDVKTNSASYQMPLVIYYVLFVFIFPAYIVILVCILKWRKRIVIFKSTFYTILIQHTIADILALLFYASQKFLYVTIPYFLFKYQRYRIAAVFYNGLYWFMTIHRFLIIVKPNLKMTQWTQKSKPWKVWILFWGPSIILSAVFFSDTEIGFDSLEKMLLAMDPEIISRYTRIIFLYLLVTCLVCLTTYAMIFKSIRIKSHSESNYFFNWWQMGVYALFFLFINPLSIFVFIFILKLRRQGGLFKTAFYTILIQQNIADFISQLFYSVHRFVFVILFHLIFYHPELKIAAIYYNGIYWCTIFRVNGILFMTIHRFLVIVKPVHKITWFIQQAKPWKIWSIFWLPSIILSLFYFMDPEIGFDSPENMSMSVDFSIVNILICLLYITCAACIVLYGSILQFIKEESHSISQIQKREIRLVFQVLLSFFAQFIFLIYFLIVHAYTLLDDNNGVVETRKYYPIAYGTLSYITPFTILIFNKDVSRNIQNLISKKTKDGISESLGGSITVQRRNTGTMLI